MLLDYANADASLSSPEEHSEIVFMGTGTSEGIPRVSCLTNPLKTCSVFVFSFSFMVHLRFRWDPIEKSIHFDSSRCVQKQLNPETKTGDLTPASLFGTSDHPEQVTS